MRAKAHDMLDAQALSALCEQLLLLEQAGMPLLESVDTLAEEYVGTPQEKAFAAMNEQMKNGGMLADAMAAAGIFPAWMVGMMRAGEQAGETERMLRELAAHFARAHQLRTAVTNAVRYPLTLTVIMTLVLLVLIFQVMPVFAQAFGSLGLTGGWSEAMLRLSRRVGTGMLVLVSLFVVTAALLYTARSGGKRQRLRAWLLGRFHTLSRLQSMMTAQKFASVLSMLLASGFPIETAMELLPDLYDAPEDKQRMRECEQRVMEGQTIFDVVENIHLFEPLYLHILHVGFAAGQMDTALSKVAQMLAQEIDDRLAQLISRIEPALVILLGVMIGALLLCVLAPLSGVLGAMA